MNANVSNRIAAHPMTRTKSGGWMYRRCLIHIEITESGNNFYVRSVPARIRRNWRDPLPEFAQLDATCRWIDEMLMTKSSR